MHLSHPQTIPPRPLVSGKIVFQETSLWCQKGWGTTALNYSHLETWIPELWSLWSSLCICQPPTSFYRLQKIGLFPKWPSFGFWLKLFLLCWTPPHTSSAEGLERWGASPSPVAPLLCSPFPCWSPSSGSWLPGLLPPAELAVLSNIFAPSAPFLLEAGFLESSRRTFILTCLSHHSLLVRVSWPFYKHVK